MLLVLKLVDQNCCCSWSFGEQSGCLRRWLWQCWAERSGKLAICGVEEPQAVDGSVALGLGLIEAAALEDGLQSSRE